MEIINDDFERECTKESLYLQEQEHEMWLWWQEARKMEQGDVIIENDNYNDYSEIPSFIREGMEP